MIVEQSTSPLYVQDVSMDDENVGLFPDDAPNDEIAWKKVENNGSVLYFEESDRMIWIIFIGTESQHRNRGKAKELIHFIHQYAKQKGKKIEHGNYTDDGLKYLKPINTRLGSELD